MNVVRIDPVLTVAKERLWEAYVGEIGRCRKRVDELRGKYPSATAQELAQRLTDTKKTWASTGGAISGLFGLALVPADLVFVTVLQLTLIMEIALLHKVNLKSDRRRERGLRGARVLERRRHRESRRARRRPRWWRGSPRRC